MAHLITSLLPLHTECAAAATVTAQALSADLVAAAVAYSAVSLDCSQACNIVFLSQFDLGSDDVCILIGLQVALSVDKDRREEEDQE